MLDLIKKTYLLGLGLATVTREKLEEIVDELVKRGEIAEKDRTHVLQDLMERAKEQQQRLTNMTRDTVQRIIQEFALPSGTQFRQLEQRVEALEKEVERLKATTDEHAPGSNA